MQPRQISNRVYPYLASSPSPKYNGGIYLCVNGRRHWVMSGDVLPAYGLDLAKDLIEVSDEHLDALRPAQIVPRVWSDDEVSSPPPGLGKHQLREIAAARLFGTGLEVGALAAPLALPLHCNTIYADFLSYDEILEANPNEPRTGLVIPSVRVAFDTLDGISEGGLDYLVASHVIEHTRDPIGAITRAYAKLRKGGSLVLVAPDMRRTFDKDRALTPLDHLIADFSDPSHERDAGHYHEFFTHAFPLSPDVFEQGWRESWEARQSIHFHTWLYESFAEMVEWIRANSAPFASVWSHPTLPDDGDANEFYFTLTK